MGLYSILAVLPQPPPLPGNDGRYYLVGQVLYSNYHKIQTEGPLGQSKN